MPYQTYHVVRFDRDREVYHLYFGCIELQQEVQVGHPYLRERDAEAAYRTVREMGLPDGHLGLIQDCACDVDYRCGDHDNY